MRNFMKIAEGLDMLPLQLALQKQPHLWGQHGARKYIENGPHGGMTDIWARYNDIANLDQNNLAAFNAEHDSVWYPVINDLPQIRPIVFGLMARVEGERLGGVLLTKIPPGGKIAPHIDGGWHAGYYQKYYVAVKNPPGAVFGFEEGDIHARTGDVYWFRNDVSHWVNNDSGDERIAMIVCIK